MKPILEFKGKHGFLSNFFGSPLFFEGVEYPTVEHAYQAQKAEDPAERLLIRQAESPGRAKRMGRKVANVRSDWEAVKEDLMRDLLMAKFTQHPDLGEKLVATHPAEIIEGNRWHDNEWGQCLCEQCIDLEGRNLLGCLLIEVRKELRAK